MKLRNKQTGEIGKIAKTKTDDDEIEIITDTKVYLYKSISEVCQHWEDYEEPEEDFWYIDSDCETYVVSRAFNENDTSDVLFNKSIGNYFETREEAEKAIEKLKAWERLRKKHFKFDGYDILNQTVTWLVSREYDEYSSDIDLLFGGEE